jgi:hypothetical protein
MKIYEIRYRNGCQYTLSIITSHILFGLGASLSLVDYARWLAHDSWQRGSQAKWRNYRKGVFVFRKQCFHFSKLKFPSNFKTEICEYPGLIRLIKPYPNPSINLQHNTEPNPNPGVEKVGEHARTARRKC